VQVHGDGESRLRLLTSSKEELVKFQEEFVRFNEWLDTTEAHKMDVRGAAEEQGGGIGILKRRSDEYQVREILLVRVVTDMLNN